MTRIVQPTLSLLIGLAMAVYGLIHAATHLPAGEHIRTLWASMPAAGAVGLFLLGLVAVITGVAMIVTSEQALRRRVRQVDRALGAGHVADHERDPDSAADFDPDTVNHPAYYGHRAYR